VLLRRNGVVNVVARRFADDCPGNPATRASCSRSFRTTDFPVIRQLTDCGARFFRFSDDSIVACSFLLTGGLNAVLDSLLCRDLL